MILYVGNFGRNTTEDDLLNLFEEHGQVNYATIIRDRISDNVLGFAFIEMPDDKQAETAIAKLNHSSLNARTLMVCQTNERRERRSKARKKETTAL